ncbi:MAG: hypothetical protein ACERKZ_19985 [Lachnotalea sp.]
MLRFNDAPDELGRYRICQYIFNHGTLPNGGDMEIRMKAWGFSYAFQPILPYIIGGVLMKITALFTDNAYFHLISARFVSVLCGVIMAIFVRKIAKRIFIYARWQWIFTFLIMLLPQCMFMFVYVNTDSMALMSCAIIIYAWFCGLDTNWNYKSCFMLSLGIIFCAMSYYNAYALILSSIIIFIVYHVTFDKSKKNLNIDWNNFFKKGLFIILIVFIGTGWWFIRSYILYDGDFLGLRIRNEYAENYATTSYLKPSQAKTYYNAGLSLFKMLKETDYISVLASSFIGRFGNMSVVLHSWTYIGYAILFSCGIIGLFLRDLKFKILLSYNFKHTLVLNICMVLCIIIPIYLCTYSSYVTDYQPQGRYILPMIIPFMYFITIGLINFFNTIFTNKSFHYILTTILILWFLVIVYFFLKDMVFAFYWDTLVKFVKAL